MNKKYQIFISSTYEDLKEERDQVIKAVLEMGHIPVGMEMFSAGDEEQWKLIARQIEQSDYYVIILGQRYGSETDLGISYTEKEYDYAVKLGIPALGFVISNNAVLPINRIDTLDSKIQKLNNFKNKVKSKLVNFWCSKEELYGMVSISLIKTMNLNPRVGWIRSDNIPSFQETHELLRLSSENAELRKKISLLNFSTQPNEEKKIIHIMDDAKRAFRIRRKNSSKWNDAKTYSNTLLEIFMIIGPSMVDESSSQNIAQELAFEHVGSDKFKSSPIGDNKIKGFIADFVALDLVVPSVKKHSVTDKNSYWCLTKNGREMLKRARRIQLEEGIQTIEEKSTEDEK